MRLSERFTLIAGACFFCAVALAQEGGQVGEMTLNSDDVVIFLPDDFSRFAGR